jgi:3-deoxy-D-manno-octulosonate 8-phosphate phosphatase (KDO 8-P phosphatase)
VSAVSGTGDDRRLADIQVIVFDVDGVLTDGKVLIDGQGNEWLRFDIQDGLGMVRGRSFGLRYAIITGRNSPAVRVRARQLDILHIQQGQTDKTAAIERVMEDLDVDASAVAYMGDDVNDLPPMARVGFVCTPADACPEVRDAADLVTGAKGGDGAVREFIERIIAAKGGLGN